MRSQAAWHRATAVIGSLVLGVALWLTADALVSSRVLPEPDVPVEWVPANERPYLRRDRGWFELKPSFRGRDYWGRDVYDVRIDEFGFRANEHGGAKPGPAGIVFLGDSFTYGMNGPWADTFVGMYDLSVPGRILNAGVPAYSPTPYLHQYGRALAAGALARRHVVVVALDISDVHDEAGVWVDGDDHPHNLRAVLNDSGLVTEARAALDATWRGRLRNRLRFSQAIYHYTRYTILKVPDPVVFDQVKSAFTWDDWSRLDATPGALDGFSPLGVQGGLDRIAAKVAAITTAARASGSRVYLLVYPWPAQLARGDRFSWPDFVRRTCQQAGCDGVIDAFPAFRAYAARRTGWYYDLYVGGDVHFNAAGNRLVFDALAAGLPR